MLRTSAKIWGFVFVLIGLLGIIPATTPDGMLLGIFHVNPVHNVVHLLTGAIAIWAGSTSSYTSKMYFLIFGVVYGLVAMVGFIAGDRPVFGFMANNVADAWLHLGIATVSIGLGLLPETRTLPTRTTTPA